MESQVESQVGDGIYQYRGCQLWAGWYAYIYFFRDVMGWDNKALDLFVLDETLAKSCGWSWWHDDVCVLSERPHRLLRDERGRLHSQDGQAIEYPDGWGLYSWHGTRVTEQIILKPETLTPEQIMGESNAEVRRVMVERFGLDRFIVASKAKEIDATSRGQLYKIQVKDDEPIVAVKVKCSTTGQIYFLRVPPQITKADQAVAWTFGFEKVQDYAPLMET